MTSLLHKINELDLRIDNISTSGGGGTTDTTALQAQVDTNTTDISGIQTNKQNTLIAGDNISIVGDIISSSGGGGGGVSKIHFNATRSGSAYNINYNILLPFNVATLNIGSAYNTSTFTFTVPEAGTYLFFSNMLSNGGNKFQVNMIHTDGTNETVIQQVRKDNTFNLGLSSYGATTIKECNVGDEVFLRHLSGAVLILGPMSTFGGYLIG